MKNLQTYKEFLNESTINESDTVLGAILLLQAAAFVGHIAMTSNKYGDSMNPITGLKDWWETQKRNIAVNSILAKLKDDPEVISFLNLPSNKQEGQWRKFIEPKLTADEVKYLKSISRDRVRTGKINEGNDLRRYAFDVDTTLYNLYAMQDIKKDSAAKKELGDIIERFYEFKNKYVK